MGLFPRPTQVFLTHRLVGKLSFIFEFRITSLTLVLATCLASFLPLVFLPYEMLCTYLFTLLTLNYKFHLGRKLCIHNLPLYFIIISRIVYHMSKQWILNEQANELWKLKSSSEVMSVESNTLSSYLLILLKTCWP